MSDVIRSVYRDRLAPVARWCGWCRTFQWTRDWGCWDCDRRLSP